MFIIIHNNEKRRIDRELSVQMISHWNGICIYISRGFLYSKLLDLVNGECLKKMIWIY